MLDGSSWVVRWQLVSGATHSADSVDLYLEESFSSRVATPEAAVPLTL
jgi:hypothetical protein